MAETKTLAATVRSGTGKGAARSVRREGRIPAVIYGGGDAAEPISLDFRELNKLIYAGHFLTTIFEIDVDGSKHRVIPRDYQLDPIKDQPLHVDFLRLKPGSSLRVDVPVHFVNQDISPGIKKGGTLNIVRHTVEMRVPADADPRCDHRRSRPARHRQIAAYLGDPAAAGLPPDDHAIGTSRSRRSCRRWPRPKRRLPRLPPQRGCRQGQGQEVRRACRPLNAPAAGALPACGGRFAVFADQPGLDFGLKAP